MGLSFQKQRQYAKKGGRVESHLILSDPSGLMPCSTPNLGHSLTPAKSHLSTLLGVVILPNSASAQVWTYSSLLCLHSFNLLSSFLLLSSHVTADLSIVLTCVTSFGLPVLQVQVYIGAYAKGENVTKYSCLYRYTRAFHTRVLRV